MPDTRRELSAILDAIVVVCALCVGLARLHSESHSRVLPKLANTLETLARIVNDRASVLFQYHVEINYVGVSSTIGVHVITRRGIIMGERVPVRNLEIEWLPASLPGLMDELGLTLEAALRPEAALWGPGQLTRRLQVVAPFLLSPIRTMAAVCLKIRQD